MKERIEEHRIDLDGMACNYTVEYKKVKNINIRVSPDGKLHVSAPYYTPLERIEKALQKVKKRILSKIASPHEKKDSTSRKAPFYEGRIVLSGLEYEYILERKSIKHINMRMYEDGRLYISAPWQTTLQEVERMLQKEEEWLKKARESQKKKSEAKAGKEKAVSTEYVYWWGRKVPVLWIQENAGNGLESVSEDGIILLENRAGPAKNPEKVLETLLDGFFKKALKEQVTAVYENTVSPYYENHPPFPCPKVSVRKMKTRWGSCSYNKGTIRLNEYLIHYPKECCEYVIAHELCHFVHHDHSPRFYSLLEALIPDWKKREKLLRQYSARLLIREKDA